MKPSAHTDSKPQQQARAGSLIAALEEIQARHGYLPQKALLELHKRTGASLVDIYGVATFYRAFSLKPRGKHLVSVCLGTACHVNRAPVVAREVERLLDIKAGDTTNDREFTLETVNCLGACALGPVVVVDGHYFPAVSPAKVSEILQSSRDGLNNVTVETDQRVFPLAVACARCNHSLMDPTHPIDGHPSIRVTAAFDSKHGWVALSCLYGSYNVDNEYEIPEDVVVNMFCPHCHAELLGGGTCLECGAPMVPMIVRGGGIVQICSRRGCRGHMLDVSGAIFA